MSVSVGTFLAGVLKEIRVSRPGGTLAPEDQDDLLYLFNELLDEWNADDRCAYTTNFPDFVLVPNLNPHTIGPAGSVAGPADPTFVVSQRPVDIKAAQLNLGGTPAVYRDINIRDDAWYQANTIPGLTQTVPTDLYYSPDWNDPNGLGTGYGSIYFWGVPQTAYGVRLWMVTILAQVTATSVFSLPPAYRSALRLTLAERAAPWFGQLVAPSTTQAAREARDRVFSNNDDPPYLATADAGIPHEGRSHRNGFNWLNRTM